MRAAFHRFLRWFPLWALGTAIALVTLAITAAQVWPGAKKWDEAQRDKVLASMSEPTFWVIAVIVVALWAYLTWHTRPTRRPNYAGWRPQNLEGLARIANGGEEQDRASTPFQPHLRGEAFRKDELARKRAAQREDDSARGRQMRAAAQALADQASEDETKALQRIEAILPPDKAKRVQSGKYHDVSIYEALGWAIYAEWGHPYTDFTQIIALTFGPRLDPWKYLTRFVHLASEGKLTVWGKRNDPGYIQEISSSYWNDHGLKLSDEHLLIGIIITSDDDDPYCDLRLNSGEVEAAWPHEGRPPRERRP